MKICLITTTINDPKVLELYRQHGPDVEFFVALDQKSVPPTILALDRNTHFLTTSDQQKWKCSSLIGFSNIQRRNIALLEAVQAGADVVVSCDDDNICLGPERYFDQMRRSLGGGQFANDGLGPWSGIKVSGANGWFDVGQLLDPIAPHRGFPHNVDATRYEVSHVIGAKVGVAAGICMGDPDISAATRIARAPAVHRVSELLNAGIVVDPQTHTVFNSQNTALIRELAPAFFMLPGVGRYDDIYASLIMQRVMRERGLHVHFGKPFVWQSRNQHDLVKDLRQEIDGMGRIGMVAAALDMVKLNSQLTVLQSCVVLWDILGSSNLFPPETVKAAQAFLQDMESVL